MAGRLVTVSTYPNLLEAQVAKSALAAAGIPALIQGEHTIGNFHHHISAIPLSVDEDDAEAAEQIVNAMIGVAHAEHVGPSDAAPLPDPERCERCGSPEVERRKKMPAFGLFVALTFGIGAAIDNTLAAFYIFLAGMVVFLAAGGWRCRHCGNTW